MRRNGEKDKNSHPLNIVATIFWLLDCLDYSPPRACLSRCRGAGTSSTQITGRGKFEAHH